MQEELLSSGSLLFRSHKFKSFLLDYAAFMIILTQSQLVCRKNQYAMQRDCETALGCIPSCFEAEQGAAILCLLQLYGAPRVLLQARVIDFLDQRMSLQEGCNFGAIRYLPVHAE